MLTLRRSPICIHDVVKVGNENDQHHIIVRLFLNPYTNFHGANDLTKCNGANIISLCGNVLQRPNKMGTYMRYK